MKLERLITKGVQQNIPIEIQILLWNMQNKLRKQQKEINYLQVYRLEAIQKHLQLIEHTAEQPFYQMSYYCVVDNAVTQKVYIIETDYGAKLVETMLLAREY